MYCISDQQIDYILDDLSARGIGMERLQQNLLDHICCIIEQNLEENGDFETFYHATIQTFYHRELREIEEETILLLTFKNYYSMKKSMILSGAFTVITFLIGCFFKLMHWPGASIILVLGFISISFVFLPLFVVVKNRELQTFHDRFTLMVGVLIGILYCLSMLFQIMHWPGAHVLLLTTLGASFFVFIPVYFFTGIRKPEAAISTIVTSVILIAATAIQFTLVALRRNPPAASSTAVVEQTQGLVGRK